MSRYIDADEACLDAEERGFDFWTSYTDIENTQRFLDEQPTVDAEIVRHGRWIYDQYFGDYSLHIFKCSVCGKKISVNKKEEIADFPYCNCGAKMDGKRNWNDGKIH